MAGETAGRTGPNGPSRRREAPRPTPGWSIEDMTISQLRVRLKLGNMILRKLRSDWRDDPRAETAQARIAAQVAQVNAALVQKRRARREGQGAAHPPDLVVGVAAARVTGEAAG